ncbi:endonuclease 4-like [Humulus lupulus]|uniref:endonuclease 4-like n=1 Tax=Humulus lupulus TaxID=3486 RepID=UPI002B409327|nr:endonuclease 4-like [Humulus lupulus]
MYQGSESVLLRKLVFLVLIPGILGWGPEGHYATCKIAEGYLSEEAASAVKELLGESATAKGDLASVCSWPDDIRKQYPWSAALHFADTPDYVCNYDYQRDCVDTFGNKGRCVTGAIFNYTKQLSGYQNSIVQSKYNLTEALMFLSHFFGDVHQPLHMGYLGDYGGNLIGVQWYESKTNLHRVWDDKIIESALKSFYNSDLSTMIQSIHKKIQAGWSNAASSWRVCPNNETVCPNQYASESIISACEYAYTNVTAGTTLGDEYFLSRLPVVEKKLAQGGVRLAASLNRIFSPRAQLIAQY